MLNARGSIHQPVNLADAQNGFETTFHYEVLLFWLMQIPGVTLLYEPI